MKKILFLVYFIPGLLAFKAAAQEYKFYTFPDQLPASYDFDKKAEYYDLLRRKVNGLTPEELAVYGELLVYTKDNMLKEGKAYIGWKEMEDYLNKVLTLLLPDSLKANKSIHVYPYRQDYYNAFTLYDGTMFYDIGLIADTENEAALAAILGHELSHYLNSDPLNKLIKIVKLGKEAENENDYSDLRHMFLNNASEGQEKEMRCDKEGFQLAYDKGYDVGSALYNFARFMDQESELKTKKVGASLSNVYVVETEDGKKEEKTNKELFASHPETVKRLKALKSFIASKPASGKGREFIVNQSLFLKLQQQARYETLNLLLTGNDYKECLEKAFKYYLFDPTNEVYIYCILESLRRFLYVKPIMANQGFLTQAYADYLKDGQSILTNLNVLIRDSAKTATIKAPDFRNSSMPKFKTYKEAFQYFSKLAMDKNIKECYLTTALYYYTTSDQRMNETITKYLSFDKIEHKDYAYALKSKSVSSFVGKNHFLLVDRSDFYDCLLYDKYFKKYNYAEVTDPTYIQKIKEFYASKGMQRELLYLPSLNSYAFRKKIDFYNVIYTLASLRKMEAESYNPLNLSIFMIDPYYWDFYVNNNIQSFDYVYIYSKEKCSKGSAHFLVYYYSYNPQLEINKEFFTKEYSAKAVSPESAVKLLQKIEKERER